MSSFIVAFRVSDAKEAAEAIEQLKVLGGRREEKGIGKGINYVSVRVSGIIGTAKTAKPYVEDNCPIYEWKTLGRLL